MAGPCGDQENCVVLCDQDNRGFLQPEFRYEISLFFGYGPVMSQEITKFVKISLLNLAKTPQNNELVLTNFVMNFVMKCSTCRLLLYSNRARPPRFPACTSLKRLTIWASRTSSRISHS